MSLISDWLVFIFILQPLDLVRLSSVRLSDFLLSDILLYRNLYCCTWEHKRLKSEHKEQ